MIYDKGIVEYVDAIRQLRAQGVEARFQILGAKAPDHKRGIPLDIINAWIKEEVIEYLGTTDDVKSVVEQADCVVLPSYREGLPRTLLEAASMGKPIITTDTAGCKHVVDDEQTGFLCKVQSSTDLAEKMLKMISLTPDERLMMGKKGRDKVQQQFDENLVINKYQEAIHGLIVSKAKSLSA